MDSVNAQIALTEYYDTKFGIFDHGAATDRPLAAVALHDAEENGPTSALYETIRLFASTNVYKYFGLNLEEFLNLPREFTTLILEVSQDKTIKDSKVLSDLPGL
jgi:hypothetical protein